MTNVLGKAGSPPAIKKSTDPVSFSPAVILPGKAATPDEHQEFFELVVKSLIEKLSSVVKDRGRVGIGKGFKQVPRQEILLRTEIEFRKGHFAVNDILVSKTAMQVSISVGNGYRSRARPWKRLMLCAGLGLMFVGIIVMFLDIAGGRSLPSLAPILKFGQKYVRDQMERGICLLMLGLCLSFVPAIWEILALKREDDARRKAAWQSIADAVATFIPPQS